MEARDREEGPGKEKRIEGRTTRRKFLKITLTGLALLASCAQPQKPIIIEEEEWTKKELQIAKNQMFRMSNEYNISSVAYCWCSHKLLWEERVFPRYGVTLLEEMIAYFDNTSGLRDDVHDKFHKTCPEENQRHIDGEFFIDVIETGSIKELPNGFRQVTYVQRPEDIAKGIDSSKLVVIGGKRIKYDCPPEGWVIPNNGELWHPEIGTAIATIGDREKAVKLVAKYFELHWDKFHNFKIPEKYQEEFEKKFGNNFDPINPTPYQLAELETSDQCPPKAGAIRVPRRIYIKNRENGPLGICMCAGLEEADLFIGTRLRIPI